MKFLGFGRARRVKGTRKWYMRRAYSRNDNYDQYKFGRKGKWGIDTFWDFIDRKKFGKK